MTDNLLIYVLFTCCIIKSCASLNQGWYLVPPYIEYHFVWSRRMEAHCEISKQTLHDLWIIIQTYTSSHHKTYRSVDSSIYSYFAPETVKLRDCVNIAGLNRKRDNNDRLHDTLWHISNYKLQISSSPRKGYNGFFIMCRCHIIIIPPLECNVLSILS